MVFGGVTRELTRRSRMPQRCSSSDMSSEKAGQGSVLTLCCCRNVVATRAVCDLACNWIQNFVTVANPCQVTWNHDQFSPEACRYSTPNHEILTTPAISLDHSIRMFSRTTPNTCSPISSRQTEPGFVRQKNLQPMVDGPITIIASPLQTTMSSVIREHQSTTSLLQRSPASCRCQRTVFTNPGVLGSRSIFKI